eukprot:54398_1
MVVPGNLLRQLSAENSPTKRTLSVLDTHLQCIDENWIGKSRKTCVLLAAEFAPFLIKLVKQNLRDLDHFPSASTKITADCKIHIVVQCGFMCVARLCKMRAYLNYKSWELEALRSSLLSKTFSKGLHSKAMAESQKLLNDIAETRVCSERKIIAGIVTFTPNPTDAKELCRVVLSALAIFIRCMRNIVHDSASVTNMYRLLFDMFRPWVEMLESIDSNSAAVSYFNLFSLVIQLANLMDKSSDANRANIALEWRAFALFIFTKTKKFPENTFFDVVGHGAALYQRQKGSSLQHLHKFHQSVLTTRSQLPKSRKAMWSPRHFAWLFQYASCCVQLKRFDDARQVLQVSTESVQQLEQTSSPNALVSGYNSINSIQLVLISLIEAAQFVQPPKSFPEKNCIDLLRNTLSSLTDTANSCAVPLKPEISSMFTVAFTRLHELCDIYNALPRSVSTRNFPLLHSTMGSIFSTCLLLEEKIGVGSEANGVVTKNSSVAKKSKNAKRPKRSTTLTRMRSRVKTLFQLAMTCYEPCTTGVTNEATLSQNMQKARAHLQKAMGVVQQHGLYDQAAAIGDGFLQIGIIYHNTHEYVLSIPALTSAADAYTLALSHCDGHTSQSDHVRDLLSRCYGVMGQCRMHLRDLENAFDCLRLAMSHFPEFHTRSPASLLDKWAQLRLVSRKHREKSETSSSLITNMLSSTCLDLIQSKPSKSGSNLSIIWSNQSNAATAGHSHNLTDSMKARLLQDELAAYRRRQLSVIDQQLVLERLLGIYDPKVYPVRRAKVLISLAEIARLSWPVVGSPEIRRPCPGKAIRQLTEAVRLLRATEERGEDSAENDFLEHEARAHLWLGVCYREAASALRNDFLSKADGKGEAGEAEGTLAGRLEGETVTTDMEIDQWCSTGDKPSEAGEGTNQESDNSWNEKELLRNAVNALFSAVQCWSTLLGVDTSNDQDGAMSDDHSIEVCHPETTFTYMEMMSDIFWLMDLLPHQIFVLKLMLRLCDRLAPPCPTDSPQHTRSDMSSSPPTLTLSNTVTTLTALGAAYCRTGHNERAASPFARAGACLDSFAASRPLLAKFQIQFGRYLQCCGDPQGIKLIVHVLTQLESIAATERTRDDVLLLAQCRAILSEVNLRRADTGAGQSSSSDIDSLTMAMDALKSHCGLLKYCQSATTDTQSDSQSEAMVDTVTSHKSMQPTVTDMASRAVQVQFRYATHWAFMRGFMESMVDCGKLYQLQGDPRRAERHFSQGGNIARNLGLCVVNKLFEFEMANLEAKKHAWARSLDHKLRIDPPGTPRTRHQPALLRVFTRVLEGDVARRKSELGQAEEKYSDAIGSLERFMKEEYLDGLESELTFQAVSSKFDLTEPSASSNLLSPRKCLPLVRIGSRIRRKLAEVRLHSGDTDQALRLCDEILSKPSHCPPLQKAKVLLCKGLAFLAIAEKKGEIKNIFSAFPSHNSSSGVPGSTLAQARVVLARAFGVCARLTLSVPRLTKDICSALAVAWGNKDPTRSAYYLNMSLGVASRHAVVSISKRKLEAKQLAERSNQNNEPESPNEPSIEDLRRLIATFSPTAVDQPSVACAHFRAALDRLPPHWTVCCVTADDGESVTEKCLVVSRLRSGEEPVVIRTPLCEATVKFIPSKPKKRRKTRKRRAMRTRASRCRVVSSSSSESDSDTDKSYSSTGASSGHVATLDHYARVQEEFARIMRDSKQSTHDAVNMKTVRQRRQWWMTRETLDNDLETLVESLENSWLGPWKCLLTGSFEDPRMRRALKSGVDKLERTLLGNFQDYVDDSVLEQFTINRPVFEALLQSAISLQDDQLSASLSWLLSPLVVHLSPADTEVVLSECACATVSACRELQLEASRLDKGAKTDVSDQRNPVILILSKKLQHLPWESMPILFSDNQPVTRVPCLEFILARLPPFTHPERTLMVNAPTFSDGCGSEDVSGDVSMAEHDQATVGGLLADLTSTYYLLNPSGDLDRTQERFEADFRRQWGWEGRIGEKPTADEYKSILKNNSLFVYVGHSGGEQYLSADSVQRAGVRATTLLFGCSSGLMRFQGEFPPTGIAYSYMIAGSPAVVANLWDVTDKDIDSVSRALLQQWVHGSRASTGSFDPKSPAVTRADASLCGVLPRARRECRLRYLTGASPVCYGVPVFLKPHRSTFCSD